MFIVANEYLDKADKLRNFYEGYDLTIDHRRTLFISYSYALALNEESTIVDLQKAIQYADSATKINNSRQSSSWFLEGETVVSLMNNLKVLIKVYDRTSVDPKSSQATYTYLQKADYVAKSMLGQVTPKQKKQVEMLVSKIQSRMEIVNDPI